MTAPQERPPYLNVVEYTVAITFRVEGGVRWATGHGRARKVAEQLANAASRAANVVEVTAVAGPSKDGHLSTPERVRFAAANTGRGTTAQPDKLDRYLDPDFDRALAALAEETERANQRQEADRQRRQELGCLNTYRQGTPAQARCACVYCTPDEHEYALREAEAGRIDPLRTYRCPCGRPVSVPGDRCPRHAGLELVVLDEDPDALRRLATNHRERQPPDPGWHTRGPEGPDL